MSSLSPAIFKANDIRGIYPDTLSEDVARRIGLAFAAEAAAQGVGTVALGRDGRLSSPMLATAVAEGLRDGGMTVLDIGLAPTPALYYAATRHAAGSGIMLTGSHNPKNYNGAKMLLGGATLKGERVQNLYRRIRDNNLPVAAGGAIKPLSVQADYIAEVAAANRPSCPLSVIVDAGNGATGDYAPALYRAMGCTVHPLFCDIDGNFPNHHPDPAQLENLRAAAARLAEGDAAVALLFDGDGDRLGVLLPDLPPLFADRLLMLFARDMLSRQVGGRVVFDVKCSRHLAVWIEQHGGVADMQPTGHAFIKSRMQETAALLGGEMSGHFYFKENWYGFDDALFAGARLIRLLAAGTAMDMPDSHASPELHIAMDGKDQHQFIRDLHGTADFADARDIVTIDGLRVEYEDGFGLVRASNTTPALVLRFEADDEAAMQRIQNEFRRVLQNADATLQLPF